MAGSMFMIVNIELAGVCLGLVGSMGVSMGLTASAIRGKGTLAQKKRWLPELVTMEKVGAWAITEPDSGSDALGGMKTTVRRDGDEYLLNGQKTFITNGPYADTIVSSPNSTTARIPPCAIARCSRSFWTRGCPDSPRARRSRRWA